MKKYIGIGLSILVAIMMVLGCAKRKVPAAVRLRAAAV